MVKNARIDFLFRTRGATGSVAVRRSGAGGAAGLNTEDTAAAIASRDAAALDRQVAKGPPRKYGSEASTPGMANGDVKVSQVEPGEVGRRFQIQDGSVAIVSGRKAEDVFSIKWALAGEESEIDHFSISLVELFPEREPPFGQAVDAEYRTRAGAST